ncbi:kinase-like domain-containing protein [Lactarius sanguifluus]|nr:kinase-like domain-containing protein [Lactarius sanguifluus]
MVNIGVASGEQASASDLMVRDATEGACPDASREGGGKGTNALFGNCIGRGQFGAVSRAQLEHQADGLDYLHRSDVVHCDLKAANILTTKTGNVKLSDFGVSLNLRAMEREIKDIVGTPAPDVLELKGTSPKSDIWSLGCTVIELLMGLPPYGDIGNAMTGAFHKDPSMRPSAEQLFEHEWLKNHWGLNKVLQPQDSIPFLRRVTADLQKNGAARHLMAYLEPDSPIPVYAGQQFDGDMTMLSSSPGHRSFTGSASPVLPEVPQSDADLFEIREHTFVKTTFGRRASPTISGREFDLSTDRNVAVNCRVCMEPAKKGTVLCSHCSLIAHSKCRRRSADLRPLLET